MLLEESIKSFIKQTYILLLVDALYIVHLCADALNQFTSKAVEFVHFPRDFRFVHLLGNF